MWDVVGHELLDPAVIEHRAVLALKRHQTLSYPTETAAMPSHFPCIQCSQLHRGVCTELEA